MISLWTSNGVFCSERRMRRTDNWSWGATRAQARCYAQFAIYQEISHLFTLTRCYKSQYSLLNRENTGLKKRCKTHQTCCFHSLLNDNVLWLQIPALCDICLAGIENVLDSSAADTGLKKKGAQYPSELHHRQTIYAKYQCSVPVRKVDIFLPSYTITRPFSYTSLCAVQH